MHFIITQKKVGIELLGLIQRHYVGTEERMINDDEGWTLTKGLLVLSPL